MHTVSSFGGLRMLTRNTLIHCTKLTAAFFGSYLGRVRVGVIFQLTLPPVEIKSCAACLLNLLEGNSLRLSPQVRIVRTAPSNADFSGTWKRTHHACMIA
jgi:hypothetical protein